VFHVLGAIDEFTRELIVEGTHEGLAAARARGRTGGRKPKMLARQIELAQQMYDTHGDDGKRAYTVDEIATTFGVTRTTIYRHLDQDHTTGPASRERETDGQPGQTSQ
jgi:DNA invertase Pin-like site-specific DNA recombinase